MVGTYGGSVTAEAIMWNALTVAREGLAAGEMPIGAVLFYGFVPFARAYTREIGLDRRLAHAELDVLTQADEALGWNQRRYHPLRLGVTVEPCLMCVGAAMTFGVHEIVFGLESPGDGGTALVADWQPRPQLPSYIAPVITGGVLRERCLDLFRDYCETTPESPFRRWAATFLA
jgi:tRNA(adenine34) deaminase